jgi:hypothetical protein
MRREAIWSLIRWAAAFVTVTVHTFTLALAADIGRLGVVTTTTPREDAGFALRWRITPPGALTCTGDVML